MKINKSSWHYRLVDWMNKHPSRNLCIYFWQLVFASLMSVILVVLCALIAMIPISAIGIFFLANYVDVNADDAPWWSHMIMGAGIVGWGIAIAALLVKLWNGISEKIDRYIVRKSTKKPKPEKQKESSIIVEYIRAKKQKICPLIEFEESK